jgi:hypothetical protein
MSENIPTSFVMAKEKIENKVSEDLEVSIATTGTLIVKRKEDGEVVDYMEFNPKNSKWAWETERDLPVKENGGGFKKDSPTHIVEKVKTFVIE